ncbi:FAD-binding molybdopterin dehydrogenase [Primorskyibacter flagellatus]|uniref:FAD-binding molybdopterin dehydrogenase n=1 Tax=Primorskyibacter flagellatus TaxID=1387277 RepID=A0A917AEG3_9RHOB|nr:xanthine dehydrogenase family protein subunit M [Primorskyibacter flagellatus]GGE45037.1 FAD-binding molybdopterin dehydrogenase [Primorskyibacter flagellatus]
MKSFDFVQPRTVAEALAAWGPGAVWLGGGTSLIDLMKLGVAQPDVVIDLGRVAGMRSVDVQGDGAVRIGALVSNADLTRDAAFAARFPMVAEALLSGASGQLRNAATVAGNLMQHTRCAYFQDAGAACNRRDPGAGCDAQGGVGGGVAVLGASPACIAVNPSDFCVPLAALDAVVEVQGPEGGREIAMADFHLLPGDTPDRVTALAPGELIVALRLPAGADGFAGHSRYLKVRDRTSFAFATASAAAGLRMEHGRIAEARLALGAVAAKPWRVAEAEAVLIGQTPDADLFDRAATIAMAGAEPGDDLAWKIDLARKTAVRALCLAAAGTPARMPALPASVFAEPAGEKVHA